MRRLWWKFWARVFAERLDRYLAWGMYETGFTGHGPTKMDRRPRQPKPWLPGFLRRKADAEIGEVAAFKQWAWQQAREEMM